MRLISFVNSFPRHTVPDLISLLWPSDYFHEGGRHDWTMDPFALVSIRITGWLDRIAQFIDRSEVIFALMMAALVVSLGLLRGRR
jgi:hypothetical protein